MRESVPWGSVYSYKIKSVPKLYDHCKNSSSYVHVPNYLLSKIYK